MANKGLTVNFTKKQEDVNRERQNGKILWKYDTKLHFNFEDWKSTAEEIMDFFHLYNLKSANCQYYV